MSPRRIATLLVITAVAIGCSSNDGPDPTTLPDYGLPPTGLPSPPSNSATASTNASSYPVSSLDTSSCANATAAVFEFYHPSLGVHLHTGDFNEGLSNGYIYEFPVNVLVQSTAGTVPLYRCALAWSPTSHFVSTDARCEGQTVETKLGYIYSPSLPQPAGTTPWYRHTTAGGADHYCSGTANLSLPGWTLDSQLGYLPNLACKNLATTCQPFPSYYTGYTVNPGPDPDTGASVAYGNAASAPPLFGRYTAAGPGGGDAILTGDWGTSNNVSWDSHGDMAECGYTDWMTGLSSDPSHRSALHAFRCGMSEFALSARNFGGTTGGLNCVLTGADGMGNNANPANANYFRNGSADWDYGYYKHSCGPGTYMAGISSDPGNWNFYHWSLCCSQPDIGGDDCTTVVAGQGSPEQNTSLAVDENGATSPLDWDPPLAGTTHPKLECGAGRRMMGSSNDNKGGLHAILCCHTPAPAPAQASASCCSPQTLQVALANCNADHVTYDSDCNNIVAPCCNSDPNSDGQGGAACAVAAAAANADASTKDGDPDAATGGATSNGGSTCGPSGTAQAWSYAYKKSAGAGNKTFGASYAGELTFSAGPSSASGEAKVSAKASLFGQTIPIALVDLKGSTTSPSPLSVEVKVLGYDVYVSSGSPAVSVTDSRSYTETFFTESEVVILFGVPITITGTVAGQVGFSASASSAGSTLVFNATPSVGATATCSAALGGGKGAFKLTAGVEGSLNLFTASLPTTATITPSVNKVNYGIGSDFTVGALDGNVKAFLKVKLKPVFKKTFKTTLAQWHGVTSTTHLFRYDGCVHY